MITLDTVFEFFDYFYNHTYTEKGKLNRTVNNLKFVNTFLEILKKEHGTSAGKDFLYKYFLFHFNYWDKVDLKGTNSYNDRIQLSFIIGKKAFERYKRRDSSYDWQLDSLPVIKKYGLVKSDLVKIEQLSTKHKIVVKKGIDTEASFKLASFNTQEGYVICKDYSTLYNHKSEICGVCIFKDDCKKMLKSVYPSLYRDRGYK